MSTKGHKKKHNKNKENELPAAEVIKHLKYNWDMIQEQTELAKSTNNIILLGNQLNSIFGTHHHTPILTHTGFGDVDTGLGDTPDSPIILSSPKAKQKPKQTFTGAPSATNQFGLAPVAAYTDQKTLKKVTEIRDLVEGALTVQNSGNWVEANYTKQITPSRGKLHKFGQKGAVDLYYDGDHLSTIVKEYNDAVSKIQIDANESIPSEATQFKALNDVETRILYENDTAGF